MMDDTRPTRHDLPRTRVLLSLTMVRSLPDTFLKRRARPRVSILNAAFDVVLAKEPETEDDAEFRRAARSIVEQGLESLEVGVDGQHFVVRVAKLVGPARLRYVMFVQPRGARRPLLDAYDRYRLTPREVEVLALIVDGAANREIADALSIVESTVQDHVRRLCEKTSARRRGDLLARVFGIDDAE